MAVNRAVSSHLNTWQATLHHACVMLGFGTNGNKTYINHTKHDRACPNYRPRCRPKGTNRGFQFHRQTLH